MLTVKLGAGGYERDDLERAAEILEAGGVGILPTDTVYGLCARADSETGVKRVFEIKERDIAKPLPILISEFEQARELAIVDAPEAVSLMREYWPGPLTLVLRRRPDAPRLAYQGEKSIALRIPDSPFCLALIDLAGCLVGTSANLSGDPSPVSFEGVSQAILGMVDFAVEAGACRLGLDSTVVDATGKPRILREGALLREDVERVAGRGR